MNSQKHTPQQIADALMEIQSDMAAAMRYEHGVEILDCRDHRDRYGLCLMMSAVSNFLEQIDILPVAQEVVRVLELNGYIEMVIILNLFNVYSPQKNTVQ